MSEVLIQIKMKATNQLASARERIAYRMFAEGLADLSENASIIGAKDEEEVSEIRMTIKAFLDQRARIPHGKAFAYGEKFDEAEKWLKEILIEGFTIHGTNNINEPHIVGILENGSRHYQDEIVGWVQRNCPSRNLSAETIKRRLRSIRAKGGLETDGDGNYWTKRRIEVEV